MKADRDCLDPAERSMAVKTSPESVIEAFSFILLLYYLQVKVEIICGMVTRWPLGVWFLASHPSAKNAERDGAPSGWVVKGWASHRVEAAEVVVAAVIHGKRDLEAE